MKTIFTYLIIAMLVSSCEKDPPTPGTGGGELPGSNETAHDPDLIKREELKQNLIAIDGTFENLEPSIDWGICGAASIVKNGDAKHGDGHLILNTSGDPCIPATSQYYNDTNAIFSTNVNLDAQPEIIYVSFYIKTSRPLSAFVVSTSKPVNFSVYFLNAEKNYSAKFSNVYEEIIDDEWQKITLSMEKSELVEGMFGDIPKYLNMSLDAHETVEIAIDNIRLTYEKELTQPEPMPANLVSNTSDVILMTDYTKNVPVTMNANGTNMVHYDDISTEDASCLPYWYGDNQITLAITNVTGFNITGNYNPGIGSDFYKYDLNSGNNEELYSTNGHAGIWDYEDFYAGEATHVTVKRAAWDYERSIGAVTVCGQNSTFGGVSDEFCLIYLMDLKGNVLNNDDPIRGNYASFSPNGKLAYITPAEYVSGAYSLYKSIRVITNPLDGPSKAEIVYENGKINDVVEWSSDGNSVVFMEQGGATLDWGWAGGYAQSITSLNLSTGRAKELLLADHGQVYPNVSWSNDGNFIIYSIKLPTDRVDWVDIQVWWLEVATGKTGPITNTLDVFGATYRK